MVYLILPLAQKLGNLHQLISLALQRFDNARQRLRCVLGCIVEQDNASRLHPLQHPLLNFRRLDFFPVQGIPTGNRCKRLYIEAFET